MADQPIGLHPALLNFIPDHRRYRVLWVDHIHWRNASKSVPDGFVAALLLGALQLIGDRCSELESGARVVDAILTNTVLPVSARSF